MIFVAVRPFSEVLPLGRDTQLGANDAWSESVEGDARLGIGRQRQMVRWLSEKAKDGFRAWVEIVRRDPTPGECQRITGIAGYRFSDPNLAICFELEFGMPAPPHDQ